MSSPFAALSLSLSLVGGLDLGQHDVDHLGKIAVKRPVQHVAHIGHPVHDVLEAVLSQGHKLVRLGRIETFDFVPGSYDVGVFVDKADKLFQTSVSMIGPVLKGPAEKVFRYLLRLGK